MKTVSVQVFNVVEAAAINYQTYLFPVILVESHSDIEAMTEHCR